MRDTRVHVGIIGTKPRRRARASLRETSTVPRPLHAAFPAHASKSEALLTRLRWDAVLCDLQKLERQIGALEQARTALTNATAIGDVVTAMRATRAAEDGLATIAAITTRTFLQVVPADGHDDTVGSLSELALRAARMVVLAAASDLRAMLRGPAGPCGRFQHVDAVILHLVAEIDQLPAMWKPYRDDGRGASRAMYRSALRGAREAMNKLTADPDLTCFLHEVTSRTDRLDVRLAGQRLSAALSVHIDAEPDSPLFLGLRPLLAPSGIAAKQAPGARSTGRSSRFRSTRTGSQ
jgi:hypothetical protein